MVETMESSGGWTKWLGHISLILLPPGLCSLIKNGLPRFILSPQPPEVWGCWGGSTLSNMVFSMSTSFLRVSVVTLRAWMLVSKSCRVFIDWRGREEGKTWSWVWLGAKAREVWKLWRLTLSKKSSGLSKSLGWNTLRGQQMTLKSTVLWSLRWPGWTGGNPVFECIQ